MNLKQLIITKARERMNRGEPAGEALDAVMASEVDFQQATYSAKERSEAVGAFVDELANEHLRGHPELKGDYSAAVLAVLSADPNLARRYDEQQKEPSATERMEQHAATSQEVDRAVQAHQARNPGTDYGVALDAVLAADPELRRRYEGRP